MPELKRLFVLGKKTVWAVDCAYGKREETDQLSGSRGFDNGFAGDLEKAESYLELQPHE
ncbi:hypothetical protein HT105_23110 [Bacteroides fragilis]|nr:hypothetical protein [Bacteroides fragilis]